MSEVSLYGGRVEHALLFLELLLDFALLRLLLPVLVALPKRDLRLEKNIRF